MLGETGDFRRCQLLGEEEIGWPKYSLPTGQSSKENVRKQGPQYEDYCSVSERLEYYSKDEAIKSIY